MDPAYGRAKAGRPARTYIQQLCEDTGCSPEDLPEAMNDREKWRERIRNIRASEMRWWNHLTEANINVISCLNFWDESCGFLSLMIFWLSSSSLLIFPQRFGRYVLRPSSGVYRSREHSQNFELRPLLNPRGSPVLIPFAITVYKC